jgi:hypothetical protein
MNLVAIIHSTVSLLVLVFGLYAWKLTSSRSIAFNAVFGSAAMLFAAYFVQTGREAQLTVTIPFVVFSLYGGRALGLGYRSLKEKELKLPACVLGVASLFPLAASFYSYFGK